MGIRTRCACIHVCIPELGVCACIHVCIPDPCIHACVHTRTMHACTHTCISELGVHTRTRCACMHTYVHTRTPKACFKPLQSHSYQATPLSVLSFTEMESHIIYSFVLALLTPGCTCETDPLVEYSNSSFIIITVQYSVYTYFISISIYLKTFE